MISRAADRTGRSLHVMCAFGVDVAATVLDVARTLGAARVVALRAEDADPNEERQRAVATWNQLAKPRQSLHVDLVGRADGVSSFELPAA